MRDLSPAARRYLLAVWTIATLGLAWAVFSLPWPADQLRLVPLWLGAYALADYVEAVVEINPDQRLILNVSSGMLLFLTVVSGAPGILAILGGTLVTALLRRPAWYRSLFNAAKRVLIYLTLLGEFRLFQPPDALPFSTPRGFLVAAAMIATDVLLDLALNGPIIALASQQPLHQVYQAGFRSFHWVQLLVLPLGTILAALWFVSPWLMLLGSVPLVMAQRAFTVAARLQRESRHNQLLAEERAQLAESLAGMNRGLEVRVAERTATLAASEARLQLLLEQMPAVLWTTDAALRITSLAGAGLSRLHVQPAQLIDRPLIDLFQTADPSGSALSMHRQALTGESASADIEWASRTFQAHVEPFRDSHRQIAGSIGVALDMTERVVAERERERLIGELQAALANIKTLRGLIPICAACKKIRDDSGYWNQLEGYIQTHSEAEFSHSICPDCTLRLYPELYADDPPAA